MVPHQPPLSGTGSACGVGQEAEGALPVLRADRKLAEPQPPLAGDAASVAPVASAAISAKDLRLGRLRRATCPLPAAAASHRPSSCSESCFSEEPDAVVPHVRIRGGVRVGPSPTRPYPDHT